MDRFDDLPIDPDAADPDPRSRPTLADVVRGRWDIVGVIALGGAIGGGARWLLGLALPHDPGAFPWATFLENVTGALLIGVLLVVITERRSGSRYARPFLGVGVLGGFTTFSAYTAETLELIRSDAAPLALVYLFGTLAVGIAAAWLGITIGRAALRGSR